MHFTHQGGMKRTFLSAAANESHQGLSRSRYFQAVLRTKWMIRGSTPHLGFWILPLADPLGHPQEACLTDALHVHWISLQLPVHNGWSVRSWDLGPLKKNLHQLQHLHFGTSWRQTGRQSAPYCQLVRLESHTFAPTQRQSVNDDTSRRMARGKMAYW